MPASRWNVDFHEIIEWVIKGEQEFSQILLNFDLEEANQSDDKISNESDIKSTEKTEFPKVIPILPLRGLVVYPQTAVPLTIGQPRSIRLVDEAVSGERWVGLVTSRDETKENPEASDLFEYGTAAIIHRLFRAPDGTIRLLVQGISRFKIKKFVQNSPYLKAEIENCPGGG